MRAFSTPSTLILLVTLIISSSSQAQVQFGWDDKPPSNSVSAIFVFGDSTSDPGNNNYITTTFRSNFAPYGRDFANQVPTGRFTNGRLTSDFVARYVGIKEYVPPYLDPTLSDEELMTGVSFASAGSGYDPLTPQLSRVISLPKQLDYFREYRARIEVAIGKENTATLIDKALFILSAATNDFVINYYTMPIRRTMYSLPQYQRFLLQHVHDFIQELWEQGARKIAVAGIPPMGCLPIVITMNASSVFQRGCVESLCSVARDYNQLLQIQLNSHQLQLGDADHRTRLQYIDIYGPLSTMIQAPNIFGFEEPNVGCCGTGYIEAAFMCNPGSYVCPDASKYIFWDSIHPTERTYYILFKTICPVIDFLIAD
ncbi:hypothetical protein Ancab_033911 [Ancistrocladus abbreviatus]